MALVDRRIDGVDGSRPPFGLEDGGLLLALGAKDLGLALAFSILDRGLGGLASAKAPSEPRTS